jgi:ubiquinol-cytochrome c reductase cytochrome b subunit
VGERFLTGDMASWCKDNAEVLKQPANAASVKALVEFLAAQSGRKDLQPYDAALVAAGREVFASATLASGSLSSACIDCHGMHVAGEETALSENSGAGAPTLTGYGGRKWLIDFLKQPGHADFYGDNNAMPSFEQSMSPQEIELLVDWMLGDYYRPEASPSKAE